MSFVESRRVIDAPLEIVFNTIADIRQFKMVAPNIEKVEFISESQSGAGTRFRETRIMNGREATTELEVTEYEENDHVRFVSDAGGTVWDTTFTVRSVNGLTELSMAMDARPYKLLSKLMNFFIKGMVRKEIEKDMDAVKAYCEYET